MVEEVVDMDVFDECLVVCCTDFSCLLEVNANVRTSLFFESLHNYTGRQGNETVMKSNELFQRNYINYLVCM